jgi:hypothetical protein
LRPFASSGKGAAEVLALLARSIDWIAPRLMLSEVAARCGAKWRQAN